MGFNVELGLLFSKNETVKMAVLSPKRGISRDKWLTSAQDRGWVGVEEWRVVED